MQKLPTWLRGGIVLCFVLGWLGACEPKTREERIAQLRSLYDAKVVTGFVVTQDPVLAPPQGEETEGEAGGEPEAAQEEAGEEAASPTPTVSQVKFDVLITTESLEKLPGITLDVTHADADEVEKDHRLMWVDTSRIERGPGAQVTLVLDDVAYEKGDGFHVEVRSPIPPEERSRYREFAEE